MYQYQCGWNDICELMNDYKVELRKNYLAKDRSKI